MVVPVFCVALPLKHIVFFCPLQRIPYGGFPEQDLSAAGPFPPPRPGLPLRAEHSFHIQPDSICASVSSTAPPLKPDWQDLLASPGCSRQDPSSADTCSHQTCVNVHFCVSPLSRSPSRTYFVRLRYCAQVLRPPPCRLAYFKLLDVKRLES